MTRVLVTQSKLDELALQVSAKSGEAMPLTIDEMAEAVEGIDVVNNQSKTVSPSTSSQTVEPDSGYTGLSSVTVEAISPVRTSSDLVTSADGATVIAPAGWYASDSSKRVATMNLPTSASTTASGTNKATIAASTSTRYINIPTGYNTAAARYTLSAMPTMTLPTAASSTSSGTSKATISPSESNQYINIPTGYNSAGAYYLVAAVSNTYVGSGITRRDSTDLTASGATVTAPKGYYPSSASKSVATGSVSASATKGSVSNHSVQVTPTATVGTAGYLAAGSTNGTAVTVQASELVSGNLAITENGSGIDCSTYSTVSVNVSGGGSSGMQVGTKTATLSSAASSIQFTGLSGEPTSFVATSSADQSTGGTKVVGVVYDGTSCHGIDLTTQASADTGFTQSYSNGTLTITATTASFQANEYKLVYTYGGTAGNVYTEDVQVGSGATSITFTGLSDEPDYFSCIFKSTFSTSSGYQRVMEVVYDGSSTYGHALDSSAHALTSWTHSYSNGSLTITSTGTNNGGYFHQPGSYQLTAGIGGDQTLQTKTVTPTTSTQNVTADTGYTALKKVVVNPIPSQYIVPTGNIAITSNTATGQSLDVSQYATATVAVPTSGGGASIDTKTTTSSNRPTSLSFTSMKGEPIAFVLRCTSSMSRSSNSTYYYVATMRYNGTNTTGNCWRMSNGNWTNITSGYSFTYSGTTLTLSSSGTTTTSPGCFYPGNYELVYVY